MDLTTKGIPQNLQFAFQEYDLNQLDPEQDAFIVIERTLAYGDRAELGWLFARYGRERLVQWLQQGGWRTLPRRRLLLWTTYFNLPPFPARRGVWTYWNVALLLGRVNITSGERQVHERLKQACQHPDNILAQATLLAGLAIEDPQEAREWFFSRVLPAAWPTYHPITVGDPAGCGSGILLLAAAACFPEWAVRLRCVVFQGIDVDVQCVRMAKINCALYGLNGYYLKFVEALQTLTSAVRLELPKSHSQAYRQAVTAYNHKSPKSAPETMPTFADLFRWQPTAIEPEV